MHTILHLKTSFRSQGAFAGQPLWEGSCWEEGEKPAGPHDPQPRTTGSEGPVFLEELPWTSRANVGWKINERTHQDFELLGPWRNAWNNELFKRPSWRFMETQGTETEEDETHTVQRWCGLRADFLRVPPSLVVPKPSWEGARGSAFLGTRSCA